MVPVIVIVVAIGLAGALLVLTGRSSPTLAAPPNVTAVAVGDIACAADQEGTSEERSREDHCRQADIGSLVGSQSPEAFLPLGDNQYPNGTLDRYKASYDKVLGRFLPITHPVPGNHDAGTGYYAYFGKAAGPNGQGYYSYQLGAWHVIALNSECSRIGGCGQGSPEEVWLKADLAAHQDKCTLAYWHKPRWSSGRHGSNPAMGALWSDLVDAQAELVLNGHDHDFEGFAPLDGNGNLDPEGVREFVVGTGGDSHYTFAKSGVAVPGSQVRIENAYGVLRLTLKADGYDWRFVPVPGAKISPEQLQKARGSDTCH